MSWKMTIAAGFIATAGVCAPAGAATISFADYAAGNEGGVVNGATINFGGVNIRFYAGPMLTNSTLLPTYFPYFDDVHDGKPAGLGACDILEGPAGTTSPGAECRDDTDDSVDGDHATPEAVALFFDDGPFDLIDISFRDGKHNPINDSDGLIAWAFQSGGMVIEEGVTTFAELVVRVIAGDFLGLSAFQFSYVNTEFYIESIAYRAVPIPGAIPLLLTGLAGLGMVSRRRKKQNS